MMRILPTEVFVRRDYSGGVEPAAFERVLPRELEGRVGEQEFLTLVDTVNLLFREAEEVGWHTALESIFGCLSCYSIFLFYKSTFVVTGLAVSVPLTLLFLLFQVPTSAPWKD